MQPSMTRNSQGRSTEREDDPRSFAFGFSFCALISLQMASHSFSYTLELVTRQVPKVSQGKELVSHVKHCANEAGTCIFKVALCSGSVLASAPIATSK